MDYYDLMAPLVDHVGDAFDNSSMAGECEVSCGVKCWNERKFDKENSQWFFGFNRTCFRSCGCEFKVDKKMTQKTKDELNRAGQLIEKDIAKLAQYGEKLAIEARNSLLPAVQKFTQKQNELKNEYLKTVRATAIQDLSCDAPCVNQCTNGYTTCFFELSSCLSTCNCDALEGSIDLSVGKRNAASLVLYAKGSVRALEALFENKI